MQTIQSQDVAVPAEDESAPEFFGKPPQPWQQRNSWVKPKRKRKSRRKEVDLWQDEV